LKQFSLVVNFLLGKVANQNRRKGEQLLLFFQKGRVAVIPFSIPVQVLLNVTKGFQRSEKRRSSILTFFLLLLPLLTKGATRGLPF
jgi:hypothetical protein